MTRNTLLTLIALIAMTTSGLAASISDIPDQVMNEDSDPLVIPFSISDGSPAMSISATSNNLGIIPEASMIVGGSGANRTLSITPAPDQNGAAAITVTVDDGGNKVTETFAVNVNQVNDAPRFNKGPDQLRYSEVAPTNGVQWANGISKGPEDESGQVLSFVSTNDNNALFTTQPSISPEGVLTFAYASSVEGRANVSVRLQDSGGIENGGVHTSEAQTFSITVFNSSTPTIVTSAGNRGAGSLREVIVIAKSQPGSNVITFSSAMSGQTIVLESLLIIDDFLGVTIDADSLPAGVAISGDNQTSVFFQSNPSSRLTLRNVTIQDGHGPPTVSTQGGAIYNTGWLTLERCRFTNNQALTGGGGAIYTRDRRVVIHQCTFSGNSTVNGHGGAILVSGNSDVFLSQCTFHGNSVGGASSNGGAMHVEFGAIVQAPKCTLTGNSAGDGNGGAVFTAAGGTLSLGNCTLSLNSARQGGALFNSGRTSLGNSIVAGNTAESGPDIRNGAEFFVAGVNLIGKNDAVLSTFPAGLPNAGGQYVGTNAAPLNAQIAPLGNYGGPTGTMALLRGSLARDRAIPDGSASIGDQRGFPIIGVPDVGAYEAGTANEFLVWSLESVGLSAGFNEDPDGDGQHNGIEYATRSDPVAGNVNALGSPTLLSGSGVQLTFPYRATARDIRYILERSVDLRRWVEVCRYELGVGFTFQSGVTGDVDAVAQVTTVTDPGGAQVGFWRLRVESILPEVN